MSVILIESEISVKVTATQRKNHKGWYHEGFRLHPEVRAVLTPKAWRPPVKARELFSAQAEALCSLMGGLTLTLNLMLSTAL